MSETSIAPEKSSPFTVPRVVAGVSPEMVLEELIANEVQLLNLLGRVCELYSHIPDGERVSGDELIMADLRVACAGATRLHILLDRNLLSISV